MNNKSKNTTTTTNNNNNNSKYIGASLTAVKETLKKKRGAVVLDGAGSNSGNILFRLKGTGAVPLSQKLANRLIDTWWASPPGTKIVVGWVSSDLIPAYLNNPQRDGAATVDHVKVTVVVRPTSLEENKKKIFLSSQRIRSIDHARAMFGLLLHEGMKKQNARLVYAQYPDEWLHGRRRLLHRAPFYWHPEFHNNNNNNYRPASHTFLFVWPAGVAKTPKNETLIEAAARFQNTLFHASRRKLKNHVDKKLGAPGKGGNYAWNKNAFLSMANATAKRRPQQRPFVNHHRAAYILQQSMPRQIQYKKERWYGRKALDEKGLYGNLVNKVLKKLPVPPHPMENAFYAPRPASPYYSRNYEPIPVNSQARRASSVKRR